MATASVNAYTQGVPFKVSLRAEQQRIKVLLNDQPVIDIAASQVTSGKVGLYARSNRYAAFDNINLVDLAAKALGGNIIHVDASNQSGKEDGLAPATAWRTITKALSDPRFQNTAGDTILIDTGVYDEQVDVSARMSGIPGALHTIRAADGAQVEERVFSKHSAARWVACTADLRV